MLVTKFGELGDQCRMPTEVKLELDPAEDGSPTLFLQAFAQPPDPIARQAAESTSMPQCSGLSQHACRLLRLTAFRQRVCLALQRAKSIQIQGVRINFQSVPVGSSAHVCTVAKSLGKGPVDSPHVGPDSRARLPRRFLAP